MAEITGLLKKLQIKSGARLWFINVPLEIAEALTAGAEVQPARPGEPYDGDAIGSRGGDMAGKIAAAHADPTGWFASRLL